jgi:hypothetical protein
MHPLTRSQSDTLAALAQFGVVPIADSVRASGAGITFAFACPWEARQILGDPTMFGQGRLGILHSRVVGGVLTEYRSYRTGEAQSLHVVIGKEGSAFADLDRFNPYQGPASLLLHGVLELAPHLARRLATILSR